MNYSIITQNLFSKIKLRKMKKLIFVFAIVGFSTLGAKAQVLKGSKTVNFSIGANIGIPLFYSCFRRSFTIRWNEEGVIPVVFLN